MVIFDISRTVPKKIYAFEEVSGGILGSNCLLYNF